METNVTVVGIVCLCIVAVVAIVFGRQMGVKWMGGTLSIGQVVEGQRDLAARPRAHRDLEP
jgi:hypothetical protein